MCYISCVRHCARAFKIHAADKYVKRILAIPIVDEGTEAQSWDWVPVRLTSYLFSWFFLERGQGGRHTCILQAIWNSEAPLGSDSCFNYL